MLLKDETLHEFNYQKIMGIWHHENSNWYNIGSLSAYFNYFNILLIINY